MNNDKQHILPYTPVFIRLLKGPIEYLDKTAWEQLLQYQSELTRFLQQLGLNSDAKALGERELQRATEENKSMARARWFEMLERPGEAAEAWETAGRKDKAFPLLEKAGQFGKGARLAEEIGNRNEAIRLFRRAGEDAEADRLEALPPAPPPAPLPEPPDHEAEGGEQSDSTSSPTTSTDEAGASDHA